MLRSITTLALSWGLVASLTLARPAAAEDTVPAIGYADWEGGRTTFDGPIGVSSFRTTQAWGTVLGWHEARGVSTFNLETGDFSGEFFARSLEDRKTSICGTFTGKFTTFPDLSVTIVTATILWSEGTGRLEGVSGRGELLSEEDRETGTGHYEYHGFFRLP